MIKKIVIHKEFKGEHRGIKKPFVMIPKPGANVIVGENGCGKSSLFWYLQNFMKHTDVMDIEAEKGDRFSAFDSEKDNPRTKSPNMFAPEHFVAACVSRFTSHGETLFPILKEMTKMENTIIFLDEPENGLSLKNQLKIWRAINKAVRQGCQVFIATHSYVLIKKFKEVFDLEKKFEFVNSEDWLGQYKI